MSKKWIETWLTERRAQPTFHIGSEEETGVYIKSGWGGNLWHIHECGPSDEASAKLTHVRDFRTHMTRIGIEGERFIALCHYLGFSDDDLRRYL